MFLTSANVVQLSPSLLLFADNFFCQQFRGNKDSNSIKYHDIPIPVVTSEIIIFPQTRVDNVGLRLELYGCDPGKTLNSNTIVLSIDENQVNKHNYKRLLMLLYVVSY